MLKELVATAVQFANQPILLHQEMPDDPRAFQAPELRNLIQAGAGKSPSILEAAIHDLLPGLNVPNVYQASRIAQIIGTFVEWGAAQDAAIAPLLNRLEPQVAAARRFIGRFGSAPTNLETAFAEDPDDFVAWRGLMFMGVAAMTMLARSVPGRQLARQHPAFLADVEALANELDESYNIAWYLSETLSMVDDLRVLVLNLEKHEGFWVRLTAVRNNFHFFTLLQCALGISESPAEVCQVAQGEAPLSGRMSDHAVYTYLVWSGLLPDGSVNPIALAWGEAMPTELPDFQGAPILLLGSGGPHRSWDGGFFAPLHDALHSSVEIEQTLDSREFDGWLERLRSAPRA